jgi:hypothetical protein
MYRLKMALILFLLTFSIKSFALSTKDLTQGITPTDLIAELINTSASNVTYSNIRYRGHNGAAGIFRGGISEGLGIESGIMLSTGRVADASGPNQCFRTTAVNNQPGDTSLSADSFDAAVLEFDFVPKGDKLQFNYVFASEEYNEWVGSQYNDAFAFFLDGRNIALIPNTTMEVSINSVNNGVPYDIKCPPFSGYVFASNAHLYNDNVYLSPAFCDIYKYYFDESACGTPKYTPFITEFDGFTKVLTATATVVPGKTHHIKLTIADRGDYSLDSAVFIQGKSFAVELPPPLPTPPPTSPPVTVKCQLYAVRDDGLSDSQLLFIDLEAQTIQTIGEKHPGYDIEALDAHPIDKSLYAASGGQAASGGDVLYQIDKANGALTLLGHVKLEGGQPIQNIHGLSFNPSDNTLWGIIKGGGLIHIDISDPTTLTAKLKWSDQTKFEGLTWDEEGQTLYLAKRNALFHYDGKTLNTFCTLSADQEVEALEIISGNILLLGIHGNNVIYQLDTAEVIQGDTCAIKPFDIPPTGYEDEDIEGMAWICTKE